MEDEAKAFEDNGWDPVLVEEEKDSGVFVGMIRTVSISYAMSPVATLTSWVLNISAAVNLSNILVGEIV